MKMNRTSTRRLLRGITAGFISGLAASAVMSGFQTATKKIGNPMRSRQSGRRKSPRDEPATYKAASVISTKVFHHRLTESGKNPAATALHYLFGAASGAIYGAMAETWDFSKRGHGALFGTGLWAVADETVVPALGLAKWATAYPAFTHVYALASHVVYGVAAETFRYHLRRALRRSSLPS
jgi:uncharacterized membrane protein YagU involved in acid resistance